MAKTQFSTFLEKKFLEWQIQQGKRTTLREFSEHLGVSRAAISLWLNGDRVPDQENIQKLAEEFGYDVYDALDLPRPNPFLQKISKLFDRLSPEQQQKLAEDAERYETNNKAPKSQRASKERKTQPNH